MAEAIAPMQTEIEQIAPLESIDILFTGEPGTGKTYYGNQIHELSPRARKPFVAVNCAQFSPALIEAELFGAEKGSFTGAITARVGKFEAAAGGTLFLDEIGELPFDLQAKLLKAIEEKQIMRVGSNTSRDVDVRLIFATNQPLERFREDFKQRLLCAYPIRLQSLSERRSEIPALIARFVQEMNREMQRQFVCPPDLCRQLQGRPWTGNIRELRGTIRRLCIKAMINAPTKKIVVEINLETEEVESEKTAEFSLANQSGAQSASTACINAGLFRRYRREDELFARAFLREQENLTATGLNLEQVAHLMGLKRRTFFYRLKRSREVLARQRGDRGHSDKEADAQNSFDTQLPVFRSLRSSSSRIAA